MPKQTVNIIQQTISPQYGVIECGKKELDIDYAKHLIEIGNAEPLEAKKTTAAAPARTETTAAPARTHETASATPPAVAKRVTGRKGKGKKGK